MATSSPENCIECGKPISTPYFLTEDGKIHTNECQRYMVANGRWPPHKANVATKKSLWDKIRGR